MAHSWKPSLDDCMTVPQRTEKCRLTFLAALVPSLPEIKTLLARLTFKPSHEASDIFQWSLR